MTLDDIPRAIERMGAVEQDLVKLRHEFEQAGLLKVFRLNEAAELLRISPTTLLGLIRSSQIRAFHPESGNSRWLITSDAIRDYIAAREQAGVAG